MYKARLLAGVGSIVPLEDSVFLTNCIYVDKSRTEDWDQAITLYSFNQLRNPVWRGMFGRRFPESKDGLQVNLLLMPDRASFLGSIGGSYMYRVNASNGKAIWSRLNVEPWGKDDSPRSLVLTSNGFALAHAPDAGIWRFNADTGEDWRLLNGSANVRARSSLIFNTDTGTAYLHIESGKVLVWNELGELQAPISFPPESRLCSGVRNGFLCQYDATLLLLDPLGNIVSKWVFDRPGERYIEQRLVAPDGSVIVLTYWKEHPDSMSYRFFLFALK